MMEPKNKPIQEVKSALREYRDKANSVSVANEPKFPAVKSEQSSKYETTF
jgi:hypothetical protein